MEVNPSPPQPLNSPIQYINDQNFRVGSIVEHDGSRSPTTSESGAISRNSMTPTGNLADRSSRRYSNFFEVEQPPLPLTLDYERKRQSEATFDIMDPNSALEKKDFIEGRKAIKRGDVPLEDS
jgi:hypothetical protein